MKKYKIVNKFRFYSVVSLTLVFIFISMFFIVVNAKSTSTEVLVPVYVSQGDNLWNLSAKYSSDDIDIRSYIHKVMVINNLNNPNIKPGDMLMFPQYTK